MKRICALVLMLIAAPLAAQDSALQRLDTGEKGRAWQAVGRIDIARKGFCTGTLITQDTVLTAAHCVVQDGAVVDPDRVRFRAGLRRGHMQAERAVRRVIIHPEAGADTALPRDVAILELERAIRLPGLKPFAVGAAPWPGRSVAVVSYAAGREEVPSLQQRCTSLGAEGGVAVLTCDVNFGASGAPVFQNGNVVGMITAMSEMDGRRVALALELPPLLSEINAARMRGDGVTSSSNRRKVVRPRAQ